MSSLSRGATGAGKPKPLNVNSIYAGRNLAAGARPLGKHGLQSVGKSIGVVRRMPPPATLPSLKAENNGQDPTIAVVPQGGTGWNKGESSTAVAVETPKTSVSASALVSNGPDLRPTWAKPPVEPSSVSTGASNREFPSLSVAAQGKDALLKPQNKWATGSLTPNSDSRSNTQSANNLDEERQLPSRYYDSGNQQSSRLAQTQQRSRFQGSSDARMSQPNYYANSASSNGRKFSENEKLDDQSDSHDELFSSTKDRFSEKSDGHHISEGFFEGSHSQDLENFPQPPCNTSLDSEANIYGDYRRSDLDRDISSDRGRQKKNNYRNGQSSDDLTHWDEQERPSSRDSYGQRSHVYQHHLHQNGSDYRGVATQRKWGQSQQSVSNNQQTHQQHYQKRGSYHRDELLAPLSHSIPVPEYRLLKRPEKKLELEDVSDDEEDIQMTKLNKPALRVVKRVAVGENSHDSEGNSEEKNKEEMKKEKGFKSPIVSSSWTNSISKPNCDQLMFKKSDRTKPCEVPVPKQMEQESISEQKAYEDVQPAPPPAENVWAKRQEERESQERDKHSRMPKAMQQAIEQHFPSVAEAASIKVDKDAARRPADVEFARATMRARRQQGSNDVRQVMSRDENYAERRAQIREQREQRYDHHNRDRHQQKSLKENREQRESLGDQADSWDQQQRYSTGNQRRYFYQDRREHQAETSGDGHREQQNNGGQREYVNIRVMSGRRGVPVRGRGSRGGYSRGHDRSGYLLPHPQVLRRPFMDRSEQSEQEKFTEKEEQNDSFSNMGEFDANEVSKNNTSPQVSIGKVFSPAVENNERSINVESDEKLVVAPRFKEIKDEKDPEDDLPQGERVFQKGVDKQQFPRGRWHGRGSITAIRGRADMRRGRGSYYSSSRDGQLHELRGPRRHRMHEDDESEEAGQPINNASRQGRGSYSQQRTRRGQNKEQKHRSYQQCRGPEERQSNPNQERADRLKSPVVSSEGHDEWETASESSGRARKEEKETATPNRRSTPYRLTAHQIRRGTNMSHVQNGTGTDESGIRTDRMRSKNGQPASRTCRSPSENDNKTREQQRQRHHSVERIGGSDGLAGLDINNIASVVVIDEHLQDSVSGDAIDEFEEVLNKRAKKQKALEQQQKLEAEERRKQKERERSERLQARRIARQTVKKEAKKLEDTKRKESTILDTNDKIEGRKVSEIRKDGKDKATITLACGHSERKEIPLTTVWNSAHVAEKELLKDQDVVRISSVIPSPIARPTPRSKSAASDSSPTCKEEVSLREHMVELPVSLSASQPLRAEKYDFTFDPDLHEVQIRESGDKSNVALSTGANSEAGSVAEDYRLKEKLNRVKDLWSGEEKESDSPLPSNVAKVKPQPQSGCEQSSSDGKVEQTMSNSCQPIPPRSPGIAPFPATLGSLSMFPQYPMILSDMVNPGYVPAAHAPPLLPPVNATSPPTAHGTTCPGHYGPPHGGPRAQQGPNYVDQNNTIFINRHQNMTWAPNTGGPLDGVGLMGFGSTPPPQQSTQQKSTQAQVASSFTFGAPPRGPPVQQQRNFGVAPVQKMVAPPLLPVSFPPPDMMNLPPPSLGAVGSQRTDRQFSQGFSSGASTTFAPHPPPHNFNQPPPNMRFAQPPPSIGQDVSWTKSVPPPQFGMIPGPGQVNLSRVGQQQADVWSLNNHAIGIHQHRSIGMSNVNMSHKSDRPQQQLDRRGPPDEASGMKQPPSGKQPSSCPTTA